MLSRNPNDYVIVTKFTELSVVGADTDEQETMVKEMFAEETKGLQTTFWIVAKDGSYSRRYSIDSCPKWIKRVYKILMGE